MPLRQDAKRIRWPRVLWAAALLCAMVSLLVLSGVPAGRDPATPAVTLESNELRSSRQALASVALPEPKPFRVDEQRPGIGATWRCGTDVAPAESAPLSEHAKAARETRSKQVFEQTMAAMLRSSNPRAQATALMLKPLVADLERVRKEHPVVACEAKDCPPVASAAVKSPWMSKLDPAAEASLDALAGVAATSSDPYVYALAFHACGLHSERQGTACQLISAEQWARLDPDNAVPWGAVATAASERNDTGTLQEAMHRIAQARRSHVGWGVVPKLVIEHVPVGEATAEETFELVVSVISVEAMSVLPTPRTTTQFCKAEAVLDANRRQTCSQIADLLAERSDTLLERRIGMSIGTRVGWPAERIEALKEQERVLTQAAADASAVEANSGCAVARRMLDYFRTMGPDGELSGMRRLAEQAPSKLGVRGDDRRRPASYPAPAN